MVLCGAFLATSMTSCGDDDPEDNSGQQDEQPKKDAATTAKVVITYGLDTDCDDEEEVMESVATITLSDGTTQTKTFENIPHNGEKSDSIVVTSGLPCSGTITFTRKMKNYSSLDANKGYHVGGFDFEMKVASLTDKGAVYDSEPMLTYGLGTTDDNATPAALLEIYGENGYTWTKKFNITESGLINVVE